jgi:hypothetical protein
MPNVFAAASRAINRIQLPWRRMALWAALAACLFLAFSPTALADVGPKPEMRFYFVFEEDSPLIVAEGDLIECDDAACSSGKPLEQVGPQDFTCSETECRSMAYGYAPYHRLVIAFSDGSQRESNVFEKKAFSADYKVVVREGDLQVDEINLQQTFACPSLLTLGVEFFIALAFLSINRMPKRWLLWVLVGNIVTLPVVWLLLPMTGLPAILVMLVSELFAFGVEAALLRFLTRRPQIMWRQAVTLSLVMNAASFLFGLMIW